MFLYTTFTPPQLTTEQKQILAHNILAVGRDEFVFALREYLGRPPALGVKSISFPDLVNLALKNNGNRKPFVTTKKMIYLSIICSVTIVTCAIICLMFFGSKTVELICLAIALGLPVSMLYLIAAWLGMESWVTSVLQEYTELGGRQTPSRVSSPFESYSWFDKDVASPRKHAPEPRGTIRLRSAERSEITLTEKADASTLLKLSAHDWLEQFRADAKLPNAPAELLDDWETIKRWLGGPADVTNASTQEELRIANSQHEYFTRGFLRYAREGNAPTPELTEVFKKYRVWLTEIYPRESDLNAELTPEIRGVFARMFGA